MKLTNLEPRSDNPDLKIPQLDGNLTLDSDIYDDTDSNTFSDNTDQDCSFNSSNDDINFWQALVSQTLNSSTSANTNDTDDIVDIDDTSQKIPVIVGNRSYSPNLRTKTNIGRDNITIRRDNRTLTALSLPSIFVTNHRSFFPKFRNFLDEMLEMNMVLGLHSEIWEDKENVNHQNLIEEAFEIHGIKYISNPRKKRKG